MDFFMGCILVQDEPHENHAVRRDRLPLKIIVLKGGRLGE